MIKNLTEGKPLKLLFFFSLPMLMGNLFQQLYNMVDSIVVGNFVRGRRPGCRREPLSLLFSWLSPWPPVCPWAVMSLYHSSSAPEEYAK